MEVAGLCTLCGKPARKLYSCRLCGRIGCEQCVDFDICRACEAGRKVERAPPL